MEKPTIYICIEVKNRELDSQLYLISSLVDAGYRCILGSHAAIFAVLRAKRDSGGVFFDKGTLPLKKSEWIKAKCDAYVVLDQELGPGIENPGDHLGEWPSRIYPGTETLIDRYFCVGPKVYAAAVKKFEKFPEVPVMTGWPRVDLWRERIREHFSKELEEIRNEYGDFLLFPSDFGVGEDPNVNFEGLPMLSSQNNEFEKIIQMLKRWDLDPDFPTVVIRPHISEDTRLWKNKVGDLKKTYISKDFSVSPWIIACNGIIHRGSTVALEAHFYGKDILLLEDFIAEDKSGLARILSTHTLDRNGMIQKLDCSQHVSKINEYVYLDSENACQKIQRELSKLNIRMEVSTNRARILSCQFFSKSWKRLVGLVLHESRWLLKFDNNPPYSTFFPQGIRKKDVAKVRTMNIQSSSIQIRKLTINCWEFSFSNFSNRKRFWSRNRINEGGYHGA